MVRLAVAVLAAIPLGAQPSGRIVGTVSDATGAPLANVTVALQGPVERASSSDADGGFVFDGLPDGAYEVHVALVGYAPARRAVRVASGQAPTVALERVVLVFDKVVVTATKAGECYAQELPMSLSVLAADELERLQATSVEALAGRAPAVTFSQHTGLAQLTIRGIGTNAVFTGSDPSSAVYADGVYLARPAMVLSEFLDLERVEVVRGPLGPLYGRNALGGVVNLITRSPANELQAEARLGAGGSGARRAFGRLAGPIVDGRVMGSAAFLRGVRRGFVRDLDHPDHPGHDRALLALVRHRRPALHARPQDDRERGRALPLGRARVRPAGLVLRLQRQPVARRVEPQARARLRPRTRRAGLRLRHARLQERRVPYAKVLA